MNDKERIAALIIDDEVQIRRLLRVILEANGYRVFEAGSGNEALIEAASRRPEIVLLDLGLPDIDGISVLKRLREWSKVPVVILSVRNSDEEKVAALDQGADDYVTKPFSTAELLARLRVAQRHREKTDEVSIFNASGIEVDLVKRTVRKQKKEVKLSATEYSLLRLLISHSGKVLTHTQIMREVWGPKSTGQTHYLRVYIKHLREKLEKEPSKPALIVTESGIGYRLLEDDGS